MSRPYLEVTFRQGKPMAAYLYLPRRDGDRSARTQKHEHGLLVDYANDGRPIGIEMTAPSLVTLDNLNRILTEIHQPPIRLEDLKPLQAA